MAQGVRKIDRDKFIEAFTRWCRCEISMEKAAKIVGVSKPTIKKYFTYLVEGKEFPDNLF